MLVSPVLQPCVPPVIERIADALKWVGRYRSNPRTLWEDLSSGRMA
jgi:hypothetical protein